MSTTTYEPASRNGATATLEALPEVVHAFEDAATPEMVGRRCPLQPYAKKKLNDLKVDGDFTLYASPDSTYSVTKAAFDAAQKSILIGIYDFTAGYVKEWLLAAMQRGVKVTLMLDLDNRPGETPIFKDLAKHGADCVSAPSCASSLEQARYFASSHEKVIVIDDEVVLVQSGNYSDNSIPQNEGDGVASRHFFPGNRDMGVMVRSKPLAKLFTGVLDRDIKLELDAENAPEALGAQGSAAVIGESDAEAVTKAPKQPPQLFKSKRVKPSAPISVTPVLTPDNYMDVIPQWLRGAKESILIEQQYIRGDQKLVGKLLDAIAAARKGNTKLDVRVIVAPPFPSAKTWEREVAKITALGTKGMRLGKELRILNPQYFVHCHNKLVVVDGKEVLISSQNWSDTAVGTNREAGLLIRSTPIAGYYAGIFEADWKTALKKLDKKYSKKPLLRPEALALGDTVRLNWGDYAEV